MFDHSLLTLPGEHGFTFKGKAGKIEGILRVPVNRQPAYMAMLGHPHSLHGGSMTNKVVTTLARALNEAGIASICFNFRGVGQSEGQYDAGIGESEDLVMLMQAIQKQKGEIQWILAGFSFGSYVVYRAALQILPALLLMVAPSVTRYDYVAQPTLDCPWWILQGDADEVVDAVEVLSFVKQSRLPIQIRIIPGAGHFFHGLLLVLRENIALILKEEGMVRDIA